MTVIMQTSRPCLLRLSSCYYQRTVAKRPLSRKANTDLIRIAKTVESADSGTILVMAGAGLSTPSGIPDFRSPGSGIYDNLAQYNLPYPGRHFVHYLLSFKFQNYLDFQKSCNVLSIHEWIFFVSQDCPWTIAKRFHLLVKLYNYKLCVTVGLGMDKCRIRILDFFLTKGIFACTKC